ncbi:unnamed protein product [Sphagnum tenellum]
MLIFLPVVLTLLSTAAHVAAKDAPSAPVPPDPFTISPLPDGVDLIANGGFETGDFTSWTATGDNEGVSNKFPYSGIWWSELKPITFSTTIPYTDTATTDATVLVASNAVTVEYKPINIIDMGTSQNPIVQFTTVATTYYPFVAYGAGTKYTAPGGVTTSVTDNNIGTCVLYKPNHEVTTDTAWCDANPTVCTVECTRIIPVTAPVCDMTNFVWEFDFNEYQDYKNAPALATTHLQDGTNRCFLRSP